ncbi:MAG: hypothetical protein Q7T26_03730 [Dehalococcoidia bacterium]|nr:hypothetical protein [Dehalococcoidia bacterium]
MPIDKKWLLLPMVVSLAVGVVSLINDQVLTGIATFFFALVCLVRVLSKDDETSDHPQF